MGNIQINLQIQEVKKKNDVIKVHMKLIKKKCFEALFKNRHRLCVFNVHWQGIPESRC